MNIKKIEIFDDDNNLYYPKTTADNVIYDNSNLSDIMHLINVTIQELKDSIKDISGSSSSSGSISGDITANSTYSYSANNILIKKTFENISPNESVVIEIPNSISDGYVINVYKGTIGEENVNKKILCNEENILNYIYDDKSIINAGLTLKDKFHYKSNELSDGTFESEEIDFSGFIDIYKIEKL